jgi:hypothetical protein
MIFYRRLVVFLILLVSASILQSCSKKTHPSLKRESALVVDGKISDWNLPLPLFDQESKINYEVSNDANNLYVCMKIVDQQSQLKFLQNGFQLDISSSAIKGKKCSVEFPLSDNMQPNMSLDINNGDPLAMEQKIRLLRANSIKSKVMMRLKGFSNLPEGEVSLATKTGVNIAINFIEDDILIYEIALPLKSIFGRPAVANDSTQLFTASFILNGRDLPESSNDAVSPNSMQNGGGMPNRTAMPGGGGMPGGNRPDAGRSELQKLFLESRFSYKFNLAGL